MAEGLRRARIWISGRSRLWIGGNHTHDASNAIDRFDYIVSRLLNDVPKSIRTSYAIRILFKNAGFTAVALMSLAIGIGANSAIFSVTNALLLRPLPYPDADRLVILWNRSPGLNIDQDWFSPGQYLDVKTQNSVFDHTAIAIGGSFNLTGHQGPEHVDGARVSSLFFPLLSASPLLGRVFLPDEDQPGKPRQSS